MRQASLVADARSAKLKGVEKMKIIDVSATGDKLRVTTDTHGREFIPVKPLTQKQIQKGVCLAITKNGSINSKQCAAEIAFDWLAETSDNFHLIDCWIEKAFRQARLMPQA
jgi:hypothetical protein